MKNTFKLLGIIALTAVIGFSFVSCDSGGDSGGGSSTGTLLIKNSSVFSSEIIKKITYSNNKINESVDVEIWQNGSYDLTLATGAYNIEIEVKPTDYGPYYYELQNVIITTGITTLIYNGSNLGY
jgi:hypothetical protein